MIYTCLNMDCRYLFDLPGHVECCPDCGCEQIRPATRAEREEFDRYQEELREEEKLAREQAQKGTSANIA
ncbi:MAG: hypothetical protein K6F35_09935 [Lachnospiraceae bacterium]|nr:hypothetical protein [Lachnospiraceae bacterium]